MNNRNRPSIFSVNLLFLILGVLLLTVGGFVQSRELYSGLLITEFILILFPCLVFLIIKRVPLKASLRLNKIHIKQIILVVGITIFTYPLAIFFQAIFIGILNIFKEVSPSGVPLPKDGIQYIISLVIIAIAPGICEEVMFRGVIMDAYDRLGYRKSIMISALLFGIFHFNIMNFVGPTILGVVFGIMVYRTNSIYSSIIGHTVNNGIALTIGFFLNKYQEEIDNVLMEQGKVAEAASLGIASVIVTFMFLVLCFLIVRTLLNQLVAADLHNYEDLSYRSKGSSIKYLPVVIVIFMFIIINWLNFFL